MKKLRFFAAVCCVLAGCGGAPTPDVQNAPASVQRMMQGERTVSGDAVPTNPAPTDTVTIAGYRSNYTIVKDQTTNVVTVTNSITNAVQTYNNPQLIKFVDMYTSFDIDGAPGQVYRLYQAAFNRKPDLPGLGFWIYHNKNGMSITDISSNFIASDEFKSMYGATPSDSAFVDSLYQNVLHRVGEPAGVVRWQGILKQGTDRRYVLFGFADSNENKNNLQAGVQNGFDYVPFNVPGQIANVNTCQPQTNLPVIHGDYSANNNVWNASAAASYTQCINVITTTTGVNAKFDWNVGSNTKTVKTFPEVVFGWHPGYDYSWQKRSSSTTTKLPVNVGTMPDLTVSGEVTTTCATNCYYDTALDMWFGTSSTPTTWPPATEMMIWTDTNITWDAGTFVGQVDVNGQQYKLYFNPVSVQGASWTSIIYVSVNKQTHLNLNMKSFISDAIQRGYLPASQYLDSVEMGTEVLYGKGTTEMLSYQVQ